MSHKLRWNFVISAVCMYEQFLLEIYTEIVLSYTRDTKGGKESIPIRFFEGFSSVAQNFKPTL